ncbi:hypothetical protein CLV92_11635 [Kineococcus xinjiangensis]|uniref:Knr4/Smi1-like domain-containing protein n=1 Tax=Kineococcus xinjiangensis TaxID=512762 RepID=A0A2S6IDC2_9ACTN|nr:hypothetical protein [Kineococcus xinjiangensis]PPK92173.1 hypothetical protein CLV92_11635 [Kineococcus xinjiangensis]
MAVGDPSSVPDGVSVSSVPDGLSVQESETHDEAAEVLHRVADLYAQWSRVGADIATRLRSGADDCDLAAAERALGAELPPGARAWFCAVDGVEPVRSRFRSSSPTVGPGRWVPLSLAAAVRRVQERSPRDFGGRLPLFARDEQFLAVRLDRAESIVDQLMLDDPGEEFALGWAVHLPTLLEAWANALIASVVWLPDTHDWVVDPFSARALRHGHLLD